MKCHFCGTDGAKDEYTSFLAPTCSSCLKKHKDSEARMLDGLLSPKAKQVPNSSELEENCSD